MGYQFSDSLDDPLLFERVESFGGGMDGYQRATLLGPDVSQYLENVNLLDNLEARTRPGADTMDAAPATPAALIQGLFYFDTQNYEQLLAASGAKLWKWEGANWAELAGFTPNDALQQVELAQGIDKILISDGVQNLRSWDGAAFTDLGNLANTITSDPPVGATILCWHTARMFASGKVAESDSIYASFLLEFGTGQWDHTRFKFRVGGGEGDPIKALASLQDYWLAVLKENSVYLVNADPAANSAADWTITKVASGTGIVGKKAGCSWGNDFIFMSRDGVRSVRRMAAAAGQYDLSPPLSEPMQPYIDRINWTYAHLIAARAYKHLIFFAVPLDANTGNNAVLVFNARLQRWMGVWTGWTPAAWEVTRFGGVQRLVIGEQTGLVRQWKDYTDAGDDATYTEDTAAIPTKVWVRSMLFNEPVNDKDGYHAELRFSASNAIVNVTAIGDNAELRSWSADLRPTGVGLPVNLPFDLANPAAKTARRGLRGLTPFNEIYLKVESTAGWWALRNVTLSAYLNMLQNE